MNSIIVKVTKSDIKNGKQGNENFCPIAIALRKKGFERVSVHRYWAQIGRRKETYELPNSAVDFVVDFDYGLNVKPSIFILTKESD